MKKSVLNWYAAGMLMIGVAGLSSCAGITPRNEYRVAPDLVVNVDRSYANVVRKSEKEGIRDMMKLVEDPYYEEAWVFLPDESLWIETGFGESRYLSDKIEGYTVSELSIELARIFARNRNVVNYHIHLVPSSFKSRMINFYVNMAANPMPKFEDITTMINKSDIFYKLHPEGIVTSKIYSHYGVTEYYLTEKGKIRFAGASSSKEVSSEAESFSNDMFSKLLAEYPAIEKQLLECVNESMGEKTKEYNGMKRLLQYNGHLEESYESCAAIIPSRLAEHMSNEYITVRFTPYQEIFAEERACDPVPGTR